MRVLVASAVASHVTPIGLFDARLGARRSERGAVALPQASSVASRLRVRLGREALLRVGAAVKLAAGDVVNLLSARGRQVALDRMGRRAVRA